jgi:hypothetical protein
VSVVEIHDRPQREPLPTREQIEAILDEPALVALEEELEHRRQQVEVDLEYASDKDLGWERRARGFLTAVRATLAVVRKHLHRVRTGHRTVQDNEAQLRSAELKATRKSAHATAEANALARKAQLQEAVRLQQSVLNRKLVERLSYLHHFHSAAHELLSEADCRKLSEAASRAQARAAAEVLDVRGDD